MNARFPPLPHKSLLRKHLRGPQFREDLGGCRDKCTGYASVAQSVEQGTENPRVIGSIPIGGTICGRSSSGRAPPCQGGGSEFEPRRPLQHEAIVDAEMQRRWFFCVSFLHRTAKNTLLQADGTVRLQKLCISSCQTARNEVFYSHSLTL